MQHSADAQTPDQLFDGDLWSELGLWDEIAPRFGQCVLHIGTEKTGTTSLQNFLGANRAALLAQGLFVPASLSPYEVTANHERLTTFALADEKLVDDLRVAAQLKSPDDVRKHRVVVEQALREEIARLPADRPIESRTLLVSNEHCHSRLVDPAEIARLQQLLNGFARHVKVVVYLRPQHELAISLYDQALKSGYADISVLPTFDGQGQRWVNRGYFDYGALVDRWAGVFGKQNIDVRIYGKSEMENGSVIDDFISRLNLDTANLVFERNSNVSMSAERQVALNAINRLVRARQQPISLEMRQALIEQFQQSSRDPGARPARREAEAFYHGFALGNERVRRDFLPQRSALFTPDFSAYPEAQDVLKEADALAATILAQQTALNLAKPRKG